MYPSTIVGSLLLLVSPAFAVPAFEPRDADPDNGGMKGVGVPYEQQQRILQSSSSLSAATAAASLVSTNTASQAAVAAAVAVPAATTPPTADSELKKRELVEVLVNYDPNAAATTSSLAYERLATVSCGSTCKAISTGDGVGFHWQAQHGY